MFIFDVFSSNEHSDASNNSEDMLVVAAIIIAKVSS